MLVPLALLVSLVAGDCGEHLDGDSRFCNEICAGVPIDPVCNCGHLERPSRCMAECNRFCDAEIEQGTCDVAHGCSLCADENGFCNWYMNWYPDTSDSSMFGKCTLDSGDGTYCVKPALLRGCPSHTSPVCTKADGVHKNWYTFQNECFAKAAGFDGPYTAGNCTGTEQCNDGDTECSFDARAGEAFAYFGNAPGGQSELIPYLGNVPYGNFIPTWKEWEWDEPVCDCDFTWDPVCLKTDFIDTTFMNKCLLECRNTTQVYSYLRKVYFPISVDIVPGECTEPCVGILCPDDNTCSSQFGYPVCIPTDRELCASGCASATTAESCVKNWEPMFHFATWRSMNLCEATNCVGAKDDLIYQGSCFDRCIEQDCSAEMLDNMMCVFSEGLRVSLTWCEAWCRRAYVSNVHINGECQVAQCVAGPVETLAECVIEDAPVCVLNGKVRDDKRFGTDYDSACAAECLGFGEVASNVLAGSCFENGVLTPTGDCHETDTTCCDATYTEGQRVTEYGNCLVYRDTYNSYCDIDPLEGPFELFGTVAQDACPLACGICGNGGGGTSDGCNADYETDTCCGFAADNVVRACSADAPYCVGRTPDQLGTCQTSDPCLDENFVDEFESSQPVYDAPNQPWAFCSTYGQGGVNQNFCDDPAVGGGFVVDKCQRSCRCKPKPVCDALARGKDCCDFYAPGEMVSYYGDCEFYAAGDPYYCLFDQLDLVNPALGHFTVADVCRKSCKACDACFDDPLTHINSEVSIYGDCESYKKGGPNYKFCAWDMLDNWAMRGTALSVGQVCRESCGLCDSGTTDLDQVATECTADQCCDMYGADQPVDDYGAVCSDFAFDTKHEVNLFPNCFIDTVTLPMTKLNGAVDSSHVGKLIKDVCRLSCNTCYSQCDATNTCCDVNPRDIQTDELLDVSAQGSCESYAQTESGNSNTKMCPFDRYMNSVGGVDLVVADVCTKSCGCCFDEYGSFPAVNKYWKGQSQACIDYSVNFVGGKANTACSGPSPVTETFDYPNKKYCDKKCKVMNEGGDTCSGYTWAYDKETYPAGTCTIWKSEISGTTEDADSSCYQKGVYADFGTTDPVTEGPRALEVGLKVCDVCKFSCGLCSEKYDPEIAV